MPRFIFQLDAVLRHRERIEQDRRRDLSSAESEMVRLQGQMRAIDDDVLANADAVKRGLVGRLDMNYLAAHRRYMLGMQRRSAALAQQMSLQQAAIDRARQALAEAARQRKVLQKLEERQRRRWSDALARREAADADELNTQLAFARLADRAAPEGTG